MVQRVHVGDLRLSGGLCVSIAHGKHNKSPELKVHTVVKIKAASRMERGGVQESPGDSPSGNC